MTAASDRTDQDRTDQDLAEQDLAEPAQAGQDRAGQDRAGPDSAGPDSEQPAQGAHPTSLLDERVHQRHRLGVLTIAAEAERADFGYLRDALGLTAGNLSKHLTVLEDAGLIQVEKGYHGRRPRTWVRITKQGRGALAAEVAALTELVRRHTGTG